MGAGGWPKRARGEDGGELFGGYGTTVEPALPELAAEPEEHVGVGLALYALGDGNEIEAVAEADDGGGDLSAFPGVGHGTDEAGIDLQLVEGKRLEMAQAGVAGAEVVEGEARTLLLELIGDEGGLCGVADQSALGDFEDKAAQGEVCLVGGETDVPGKAGIGELGEGDVDRQGEMFGDVFGCGEDCAQEGAGEQTVETSFFGERDEVVGKNHAAEGMPPAGKDLKAAQKAGAKLDERLEERHNLVVLERSPEVDRVV